MRPSSTVLVFSGYLINGFRFRPESSDRGKAYQNSGVAVVANTPSYASARDMHGIRGDVQYYGRIKEIIQVRYSEEVKFVLFRCHWIDPRTGVRKENYGYTLVNFDKVCHTGAKEEDEPFVLANQVEQVFFTPDDMNPGWHIVHTTRPRDLYDVGVGQFEEGEIYRDGAPVVSLLARENISINEESIDWVREDGETEVIETPLNMTRISSSVQEEDEFINDLSDEEDEEGSYTSSEDFDDYED